MTFETMLFLAALTLYAVGALVYVRIAVFRAILICRVVFVLRLMAMTAVMTVSVTYEPITVWLALTYVLATLWSWRRQSLAELRAGVKPTGAARLFARQLAQ